MDRLYGRPPLALARALVLSTVLTLATSGLAVASAVPAQAATTITIDGRATGRVFDGDGAISGGGGGNSQMLFGYPEPQCGQILDYLFVPGYGAAVQLLKVEVSGDPNSTGGAEPSPALNLFGEQGFEATTVEQIAVVNGLSRHSFRRYFASKEDLLGQWSALGQHLAAALTIRPPEESAWYALRSTFDGLIEELSSRPQALLITRMTFETPSLHGSHLQNQAD